jgi:hypothetical protein
VTSSFDLDALLRWTKPTSVAAAHEVLECYAHLDRMDLFNDATYITEIAANYALRDLLEAFAALLKELIDPAESRDLCLLVRDITSAADDVTLLTSLVDINESNPKAARLAAREGILMHWAWPRAVLEGPLPGLLTRSVYEAIDPDGRCARETYLIDQLRVATPPLSTSYLELATMLATNWEGTLPELLDAAAALDLKGDDHYTIAACR